MTSRPSLQPLSPWPFPSSQTSTLGNGVEVVSFHCPGQHVVTVAARIDLPLSEEPRAREGVATITQRTLDEGTEQYPGSAFSEALENLGASLGGSVSTAQSVLYLTVPASRLNPALSLLAEAVQHPTFSEADVTRHQRLRLAELEHLAEQSSPRAEAWFRSIALSPSTRASRMTGGSSDTVSALQPHDIVEFHRTHYVPQACQIIVAGDFVTDPHALVEEHFGNWAGFGRDTVLASSSPGAGGTILSDRPNAVHADIRLGGFCLDRHDPRWSALRVASYIVGGEFLSRLNRVLREEHGYTYGVSMTPTSLSQGGYLTLRGSFRTEVVVPAIMEAKKILDVGHFTPDEVRAATDYFTGSTAVRYSSAEGIVHEAISTLGSGLPLSSVDEQLRDIASVTADTALSAFREAMNNSNCLVVVGAADELTGQMNEEGLVHTVKAKDEPLP